LLVMDPILPKVGASGKPGTVHTLLEPLGHVPPAEAEVRYYDNLANTALAA